MCARVASVSDNGTSKPAKQAPACTYGSCATHRLHLYLVSVRVALRSHLFSHGVYRSNKKHVPSLADSEAFVVDDVLRVHMIRLVKHKFTIGPSAFLPIAKHTTVWTLGASLR